MREIIRSAERIIGRGAAEIGAPMFNALVGHLANLTKTLDIVITEEGNLVSPPTSPSKKKSKTVGADSPIQRPVTADASTDTPCWWDRDGEAEARAAPRRIPTPKGTEGSSRPVKPTLDTEMDSNMESDADVWSKVVGRTAKRKTKAKKDPVQKPSDSPPQSAKPGAAQKKPPAILIRPLAGQSYSDTVRTVRSCGLSAKDIGVNVKMRETKDGSLLLELPTSANSGSAAKTITSTISNKLGDTVGKVLQLGVNVEVEVLDLDAAATAAEVLEALRAAIPGGEDPATKAEREAIHDVRIWPTRSGQQIATAKMSRYAASKITKIPVGWTMCRVRARTVPPERCFRCQAFGHNSRSCSGTDRSGACWRCGDSGHRMADCKADHDRCLACELAGFPKIMHRPGSGACAARRRAAGRNINLADG
ncbi:unnamed protein product [Aphis gossypii]|uniref:CCHC-type domain-containing protein n=1 Tax=Aphis gossypii TaxID=80765 RepID=A0A9P0JFU7_APHGO|nr:unnamed protein product [Aphis gossypii]